MKTTANFLSFLRLRMTWAPADDPAGGGAPPADPPADPPPNDPPADPPPSDPPKDPPPAAPPADPPAAKWFEDEKMLDAEDREWLKSRGLTLDDPKEAIPKLVRGHRSAEKHIGRGVDKILEKPAEGESYADWAKKNAEALGLPKEIDGYEVAKPENWAKDAPWDTDLEAQAKKIAHEQGVPPAALNQFVALYAGKVAALSSDAEESYKQANAKMMEDLHSEYGAQAQAVMAKAQQVASFAAEKIGLDQESLEAVIGRLSKDMGDAQTIRFMNVFAEAIGEDSGIGLGKGASSGLTGSRSDAQAALSDFMKADGEWAKASAAGDRATIERLRPKFDQLTKAVASFSK
ncbi:hypothetical protein BMG03_01055 [Thioclava nitratireducens]|uniref:Uncharacterized protein n=1 Tax=Thioclava nitratireducens TaxID=1915078 RepID=A0ABN4X8Z4_9RHOB|nr:hypothetical protein [Thioclava nitratireducens]AQS46544.1 hypothetical protein BMG03_01055 [Thioclava nitratireducens]